MSESRDKLQLQSIPCLVWERAEHRFCRTCEGHWRGLHMSFLECVVKGSSGKIARFLHRETGKSATCQTTHKDCAKRSSSVVRKRETSR